MNDEIDPKLKARLDELKDVPARDPHAAARGRARFLAEAASRLAPVSVPVKGRRREWKPFTGKENFVVMKAVIAIVIALSLLIGGTATVYAAQDDLPNEPLYGLKLFTENARLWANTDPGMEVELLMQFVQTRVQEMNAMAMEGETPPAQVTQRMEQHIQQALQVAAGMDDDAMQGALERIRTTLQEQERLMIQAQAQTDEETSQAMTQARETIESRIRMVDEGVADPQGFRNTIRTEQELHTGWTETPPGQQGNGAGSGTGTPPTDTGNGNGDGNGSDTGGDGSGSDNPPGTPTPKAGNGTPMPVHTPDPHGSGGEGGNKP
jgi:hypothetical protein